MRLLHPGIPDVGVRAARRESRSHGGRGPRVALRQPVPVHRLPEHRGRGAAGGGTDAGDEEMSTRLFGERVPRGEDRRFLTGRGRYTADFELEAAHAAFVRSDFAHARILGIETAEAERVPGVLGVFTHADLDGDFAERLPVLVPSEALIAPRTQHALARDEVCYAGEVVVMVVARDRYAAEDAAAMVKVDYEPLAAAVDLDDAAEGRGAVAHLDMADGLAGRVAEEAGDVDAAFATAPHV